MKEVFRAIAVSALIVFALAGWSAQEAHYKSNNVLVRVGNWCSGTIIDSDKGLVATASHCVDRYTKLVITHKETYDGTLVPVPVEVSVPQTLTRYVLSREGDIVARHEYQSVLVGRDRLTDVALLRITSNLNMVTEHAEISEVRVGFGDTIYTMGHPRGNLGTVARGTVTNPRVSFHDCPADSCLRVNMIMFDAYIDGGSSGGGLYNDLGQLVGITNWSDDHNGNAASPIANLLRLMKDLRV